MARPDNQKIGRTPAECINLMRKVANEPILLNGKMQDPTPLSNLFTHCDNNWAAFILSKGGPLVGNFDHLTFNGGPIPQPGSEEWKEMERKAGFEELPMRRADTEFQGSLDNEVDDNALLNNNGNKSTTQDSDE